MANSGMQGTNRTRKSRPTVKRTQSGDAANIFIRCMLSDISDMLGGCSAEEIDQTVRYFDYKCPYTGQNIRSEYEENRWSLDHLMPHNRESCGLNLYGNTMVTTSAVNTKKGSKDFKEFIKKHTDGTDEEKEQRIKKIERFLQQSGYWQKVKSINEIKALCKEHYDIIQEHLKNLKSEYLNFLSREDESNRISSPNGIMNKPMPERIPVHQAAPHARTHTFTMENFIYYLREIRRVMLSTANQYAAAVRHILEIEHISFEQLPSSINRLVQEYGTGGIKEELGRKSHNTWISALKRAQDFTVFLKDAQDGNVPCAFLAP